MKKIIAIVLIITGIILLIALVFVIIPKSMKANVIFGTSKCTSIDHTLETDIRKKNCLLCFSKVSGPSSDASICNKCAHELGRCNRSGKIKNTEYHYNEK